MRPKTRTRNSLQVASKYKDFVPTSVRAFEFEIMNGLDILIPMGHSLIKQSAFPQAKSLRWYFKRKTQCFALGKPQGLHQLTNTHVGLLGPEASAGAVAWAITAGLETVDVESKLKTVAMHSLPVYLRVQPPLYQLVEADNKAAKRCQSAAQRVHVCRPHPQGSFTIVDEF